MSEYDALEKSKYNEANLNILRLNDSWNKCHSLRTGGKYKEWFNELNIVWSELVQDVNEKVLGKEHYEIKIKYYTNSTECIKALKEENEGSIYFNMKNLHEFLRELQNKVGKGGSYDDGSGTNIE